ncbi:hypothetical protein [Sphingopyxis terrae]|uniref:hypothetical protein n=1 Tax=Sphingopyxis terrae TaxID=33052 RepID=UPI002A164876|nr:hypothetical protein [Sphingopyxis terrae]MDX8358256.1 hypothetical protein [Sphingopyxis terrae]
MAAKPSSGGMQPEAQIGTRFLKKPTVVNPREAGIERKNFGRCIYGRIPDRVDKLLENSDPEDIEYYAVDTTPERFWQTIGKDNFCGGLNSAVSERRQLTISTTAFRSMMLEEAYLARFQKPPTLPADATEMTDRRYMTEGATSARALGQFADCLVFRDAAGADTLLRTMPGSDEESAAARAMAPTLGACLMQGQKLTLNVANVRAFAADGLWTRFVRGADRVSAQAN